MAIPWRIEGRIARMNWKSLEDNPYLAEMSSYHDWAEGWQEADRAYENHKYCPRCGQEINHD